jgi:DNA repair protein SbcC/Rad50
MKALRLEISAFGPYAGRQIFDFRELGDSAFFLIHGPTGSGKSTILDGICHALYGDNTAGGERNAAEMRSQHAAADTLTEAVFEFAMGSVQYRVRRVPEQWRPKKRGEGYTMQQPEAALYRLTPDAGRETPLASGVKGVNEEIERILGFNRDQFRQVVVLPQGRFRDFLSADTKGREKILELLFRTVRYRDIQDALKAAAKQISSDYETLRQREQMILAGEDAENREALENRRREMEAEAAKRAEERELRSAKEKAAFQALEKGRRDAAKLGELAEAEKGLAPLEKQRETMRVKEQELEKAKKAAALRDAEENRNRRRREAADARKTREAKEEALKGAAEKAAAAQKKLEGEIGKAGKRENAAREKERLRALAERSGELAAARKAREEAAAARRKTGAARDCKKQQLAAAGEEIQKITETRAALAEPAARREALRNAAERARTRLAQYNAIAKAEAELAPLREQLARLEERLAAIGRELGAACAHLSEVETAWRAGRAVALAHALEAGKPCPVCGSKEHPAPAVSASAPPSDADLEAARAALEILRKKEEKTVKETAALREKNAALEAVLKARIEEAGEAAGQKRETLEAALRAAAADLEKAEKAAQQHEDLEKALNAAKEKENTLRAAVEELSETAAEAERAAAAREAVYAEQVSGIPEALLDPETLQKALADAEARVTAMTEALEKARSNAEASRATRADAESALRAAREAEEAARKQARAAAEHFDRRIGEAGFDEEAVYQAALMDETAAEETAYMLRQWQDRIAAARARRERAAVEARGLAAPAVTQLESASEEARQATLACAEAQTALKNRIQDLVNKIGDLDATAQKREALDAQYREVGEIAETAAGNNRLNLSFQRFVLASRLDDVLAAASVRLDRMSQGRYVLHRTEKSRDERRAGGLDLEVFDSYTGEKRPVSTLSGGEGFLASLALALGLADVVQSYAGGIRLDTLFVDEGFGSLDPESLDHAVETLMHLRRDGRIVGIISHVPALKERIDVRLEIERGRGGSTAIFRT